MARSSQKPSSLKRGRPPLSTHNPSPSNSTSKASSKQTRSLIRTHHNLHKSRAKALAANNLTLVAEIDEQIAQLGGLDAYQAASLTGQSKDRGGDSSSLLVSWLEEAGVLSKSSASQQGKSSRKGLRVLEVGALSSKNAISSRIGRGVECVRRIDLKSQEPGLIEEIDFMDLPIPPIDNEKFDVLSLSLVLNYVPSTEGRGEMLKHTTSFLRTVESKVLPCLFLVLPLPCVTNSRYVTVDRLRELMASLGYFSLRSHTSKKLYYDLFWLGGEQTGKVFTKQEVNPGKGRNNFCVTTTGP